MESCICGKKSKKLTVTKSDVMNIYVYFAIILAIGAIFSWQLVVVILMVTSVLIITLIIARLIAGHKFKCAIVWGVSYIARIVQYF